MISMSYGINERPLRAIMLNCKRLHFGNGLEIRGHRSGYTGRGGRGLSGSERIRMYPSLWTKKQKGALNVAII